MMSVVIATHDSERALLPTLSALMPGAAAGIVREVIIADAGSRDATADVADAAGCRLLIARGARGARLRAGAATARAPWLLFLQPGVVLDAAWIAETERFMEEAETTGRTDVTAAVFRPTASSRPLLVEALTLMRAALGATPHAGQGLLIGKELYDRLGGHRDEADEPERDLARRLGRRRIVMLRSAALLGR